MTMRRIDPSMDLMKVESYWVCQTTMRRWAAGDPKAALRCLLAWWELHTLVTDEQAEEIRTVIEDMVAPEDLPVLQRVRTLIANTCAGSPEILLKIDDLIKRAKT